MMEGMTPCSVGQIEQKVSYINSKGNVRDRGYIAGLGRFDLLLVCLES